MQEDFLHYIWKYKAFDSLGLKTTKGEPISVQQLGQHNLNAGPDFFNAQLVIAQQLWAGNVEIHIKSSDWYVHHHETDKAYDNVILHVVWQHDTEIFRKDNSEIPTLELKPFVDNTLISKYQKLMKSKSWINCENSFPEIDKFLLNNWLERLYIERLKRKSEVIEHLLETTNNDWEAVLFIMLLKNFGLKVNAEAFFSLGKSIEFSIVRKIQTSLVSLEALLFGQADLLENDLEDPYFMELKSEYLFLKQKFQLSSGYITPLQFFRLRPLNFPTIRLAQIANLYHQRQHLFSQLLASDTIDSFYKLFELSTSPYWKTHYTFKKTSKVSEKKLSKSFIHLLLINTIIPVKFYYAKQNGEPIEEQLIELMQYLPSEKNTIIEGFNRLQKTSTSALDSQALVQLKTEYCDKHQCLKCAVGNSLLRE